MRIDLGGQSTVDRLAGGGLERVDAAIAGAAADSGVATAPTVELVSLAELRSSHPQALLVGSRREIREPFAADVALAVLGDEAPERLGDLVRDDHESCLDSTDLAVELLDAFIEGMEETIDGPIDATQATAVEGPIGRFVEGSAETEPAIPMISIRSDLESGTDPVGLLFLIRPTPDAIERLLSGERRGTGLPLSVDQLSVLERLTWAGVERAAESLSTLTGMATRIDVCRSCVLPLESVGDRIGGERHVGVVIECYGGLSGHVVVLFPPTAGRTMAETLVGTELDELDTSIIQSTIEEVGNIITSGLVDGWADTIETTIEITPPRYIDGRGEAVVGPVPERTGRAEALAFLMESTIVTSGEDITCEILVIPDQVELSRALSRVASAPGSAGRPADEQPGGTGESYGGS